MPHIRNEQPGDEAVIHAVVSQAFGRALLSAGLARCRALRHTRVVVLGEPAYYARLGFSPAADFGIRYPGDVPREAFMTLALVPGALDGCAGVARHAAEFDG